MRSNPEARVLDDEETQTALVLAVEIARALASQAETHPFTPLLFHQLEVDHPDEFGGIARRLLEQQVASFGQVSRLGLYGGATGTAWLIAHITDTDPADVEGYR